MLEDRHRDWVTGLGDPAHPRRHRVRQGQGGAVCLPPHLRPAARRRRGADRRAGRAPRSPQPERHPLLLPGRGRPPPRGGRQGDRAQLRPARQPDLARRRRLLESAHARYTVGEVAVPYGRCTEPSNVQAGGGACPIRFRCAGCDHFRTDVSYLPDLTAYLDDLLRTRERLAAAIGGVDERARADATPAEEEITRIRRLIGRINGDITQLTGAERAQVDEAVTVIRKHRAVSLGHAVRPRHHTLTRKRGPPMTSTTAPAPPGAASTRTEAMRKGRQADSARRRQRVIAALNQALDDGAGITVTGIARAAAVDRAFLYRHRDLLGKIHALEAALPPAAAPLARPSPAPRCKPTCSPPTNAQRG